MKRLFDLVLSVVGLVSLFPIFLIVAIWIKWDSRGPVFYRQMRVGKNNTDFHLYKFRSMFMGADKRGLITIGAKDPRITPSGYFIRKFKVDEFPQLINVLKGEMSIVGPRPEVRKYVEQYNEKQMRVLSVLPGITDMASIKYSDENEILGEVDNPDQYYQDFIMPDKLEINLTYIEKMSLILDIRLIFMTISKIFTLQRKTNKLTH